jgi:hypothetical protein
MRHQLQNSTRTLAAITAGCRSIGADVVSFDQAIGGGQETPCYDPTHSHGPGYGDYMWKGFESMLKQCHADAAADNQKIGKHEHRVNSVTLELFY